MAVRRVKLHKNHPQRIPNMHDCLSTGHADTVLHNMLVAKTSSVILYTFLLVYTSIYISTDTICMPGLYSVLFADSEQQDTVQSPCLSCPAPFACRGIYAPNPRPVTASAASPNSGSPSPSEMEEGPVDSPPENFLIPIIILVHSDAFWRNLLIDYIYEFCCNSFTVCNSLQADKAKS